MGGKMGGGGCRGDGLYTTNDGSGNAGSRH